MRCISLNFRFLQTAPDFIPHMNMENVFPFNVLNVNVYFGLVDGKMEAKVVVQALRLNTLSKLTFSDLKRFDALVRDIFPNVEFQDVDYETLANAVRASAKELNLVIMPTQVSSD